ncbi:MAG TPA: hypothetical protein VD997_13855 [Phycisphaerales bacterium]|nr:hypothetical protein [Phycisphaerales bacterium]
MVTRARLFGMFIIAGASVSIPALAQSREASAPISERPGPQQERFAVSRGAFKVTTTDVTLRVEARAKDLQLRVRTPKLNEGEKPPQSGWPLLVFSHGAGGSRDAFGDLQDLLTSHGYICISPTHSDSLALARQKRAADGPTARELATTEGRRKLRNSVKLSERVADCTLILDKAADISALVEKAGGTPFTVDMQKVAVAGHSAGAFTAQLCAGVKVRGVSVGKTGQGLISIGDDRFKAAVIISGQGTASLALAESSWDAVKVPLLVFSGSLDGSPEGMGNETPATRRHPFEKSRGTTNGGPPAYLLYIEGATHGAYQGKPGAGDRLNKADDKPTPASDVGAATNAAVLTFLNAHLRDDAESLKTLNNDTLARTIPGKVEYQRK